jgi:mono/diheme cytochrome c family protein
MATRILMPDSVLGTCSACHAPGGVAPVGKSREAAQVLALVRTENILFDIVSTAVSSSRAAPGAARARILLDNSERHLLAAAEVWHSFRLDSAAARLGDARETLAAAWMALGHPKPREGQLYRPPRTARP